VARIPSLYEEHGYGALGEILPEPFMELQFFEVRLWQWIGLVLLVLASYFLAWAAVKILYLIVRPIVARTETELDDRILRIMASPVTLLFALAAFTAGSYLLRFSAPVYQFLGSFERGLALVAITWLAFRCVDVISALLGERMEKEGRRTATAVLPLGRRAVKVFLIALALIGVLQNLGFNVTGLIAGLGVGGLAVALAAQKSLENLFGGVTLITDQPVRVGDFCRFSDGKTGTIEEIGLRSTKVRTLDRTVVTVPNSRFSEIDLENFAVRDRIRLATTLGLRYETTPDQLRHVLVGLRKVLITHPKVSNDPARVRFSGFGASSLDIEIFAFVTTSDFNEFCAIREDIYLRFMDVVAASGTGFAFPSQTLYMGRDDGLDQEGSRRAEEQVQRWRREGKLPFPAFSEEEIAELNGTADYPEKGWR
jgi:MscS family membrane protein